MGSDPQRKALFRGDGRSPSKLRAVVRRRLYSFSVAAITNYCKLSGLKHTNVLSYRQLVSLGEGHSISRAFLEALEENLLASEATGIS